jgi:hypothetical protein
MSAAEEIIAEHVAGFQELLNRGVATGTTDILHPPIGETPSCSGAT